MCLEDYTYFSMLVWALYLLETCPSTTLNFLSSAFQWWIATHKKSYQGYLNMFEYILSILSLSYLLGDFK